MFSRALPWSMLGLLLVAAAAPATAFDPQHATSEAGALLERLQLSSRADLVAVPGLRGAVAREGTLVYNYEGGEPLYALHPIEGPVGDVLGIIAVEAATTRWCWYTFGFHGPQFPEVSAQQAVGRAAAHARTLGLDAELAAPRVVAVRDRRLYWQITGTASGRACEVLVPFDAPGSPGSALLSSLDGGLARYLDSLPPPAGPYPEPPAGLVAPGPAEPLARPPVWVIPGVPHHFQTTSWYCGPASGQMIMDYCGEEIGQGDIADVENDVPGSGTYATDNRRAAHFSAMSTAIQNPALRGYRERSLGYASIDGHLTGDPYNYVKNLLVAGYPIEILTCYDGTCTSGHFRVIRGYDDGLDEFIVHDPWYNGTYLGPDVHFNQEFLVESLWEPWYSDWGMVAAPWVLNVEVESEVAPGDTFPVGLDVCYPGPSPFAGQYAASSARATIELPAGFTLASGTTTVALPAIDTGDTAHVDWQVIAGVARGSQTIGFQAQGTISGSSYSYPAYTDSIGGHARVEIEVGTPPPPRWTSDERLTNDPAPSATAYPSARALCVEPDSVAHLVWADARDGGSEIYYRRWDGSWGPEVRLTNDPGYSDCPAIAAGPDGHLYVVWVDTRSGNQDVYYKSWNGSAWSADLSLTSIARADLTPAVAVDGLGHVHVVWQSSRSTYWTRILYRKWDGISWTAEAFVTPVQTRNTYYPSIAATASGTLHLVYEQDTASRGLADIYYMFHDGTTWSTALALTADPAYAHCPSVAVGPDSRVHVVWHDGRHLAGDVYYRRYADLAWGPEVHVVDHAGDSQFASVAAGPDSLVHLAWEDYRDGAGEIYYKTWDGIWSDDLRLTHASGGSSLPCVGVDAGGTGYLVWTDARDGNAEIYAKRRCGVPTEVAAAAAAAEMSGPPRLIQAVWPVPTEGATTVAFRLPQEGPARLIIFDVRGRLVRSFVEPQLASGDHRIVWDGKDQRGRAVASGIYFCRLEAAGLCETRRTVVVER